MANGGSNLGKRAAHAMEVGQEGAWTPGTGTRLGSDSTGEAAAPRSKAMRTNQLFAALEAEVWAEAEAARAARHAHEAREWRISADIASRFPMCLDDNVHEASMSVSCVGGSSGAAKAHEHAPSQPAAAVARGEDTASKAAARRAGPALPAPLTEMALEEAFSQLPQGACKTIQSVLQTWKNGWLGNGDVVETVRSFAGSSAALRDLFSGDMEPVGEVASYADMRHLERMAAKA